MSKTPIILLFAKSHIDTYTRQDGTVVRAHDDKRQPAKATPGAPTTAQYRDGIMLLHGTKVAFKKDGKTHEGVIGNKYTEEDHKRGAKIKVRVGSFKGKGGKNQYHEIDHADIQRIVERSGWHDDYKID